MADRIELINIALSRLGEMPVQDLNEGSAAANAARLIYDTSRKAVLRAYAWAFAVSSQKPVRLAEKSLGYDYAYAVPADCLRVLSVRQGGDVSFSVRGSRILTDAESPEIDYIRNETDEGLFDSEFAEALTYKLASDLAMPIKASGEFMAEYDRMFQEIVRKAAVSTKRESRTVSSGNPYLEARYA